jgi:hypothetical protein
VKLVRERDEQRRVVGGFEVLQIHALTLHPRRLRLTHAVAAGLDDARDALAELLADAVQSRAPSLVLGGVVQERADRLVLRPARLDDDRGDAEQVPEVRDLRALARLSGVELERCVERAREALAEQWGRRGFDGANLTREG